MDSWLIFDQQQQMEPVDETGGAVISLEEQVPDVGGAVLSEAEVIAASALEPNEEGAPSLEPLSQTPNSPAPPPPSQPPEDTRLNINTASPEEIEALPGVGSKTVVKIIKLRVEAPFASAEDLTHRAGSHINWADLDLRFE